MRNQWRRLLLLRPHTQSQRHITRHSQVKPLQSFNSSFLQSRAPHVHHRSFEFSRNFSSSPELAVNPPKPPSDQVNLLVDIFTKPEKSADEIKLDLDSNNIVITHDLILSILKSAGTAPDVSKRVFDWALEHESEKLNSQSYNWMLGIFGSNGFVNECWNMIEIMKKKGYGVAKGAFVRISEKFEGLGLSDDVEKLKDLYATGSAGIKISNDNTVENVSSKVSKMIKNEVWGDSLEKQLRESDVEFSSDVVGTVLENLESDLNKGLIFFRWVEESGLFKHDERTYNAMAKLLGREEYTDKFWRVVNEMKIAGYEMEKSTYVKVLERFVKAKMLKEAVDLYEFAMIGENKPSIHDCTFLLKKIVVSKDLEMDLFLKVVEIFKNGGNVLTDANLDAILKSLTSVGKLTECNSILKALKDGGYLPSVASQRKIAFKLANNGKINEALEFTDNMQEASGGKLQYQTWVSLLKGYCLARDLNEATDTLRKMVSQEGPSCGGYALDLLVGTYCRKNKPFEAYKTVFDMVNDKGLKPWCSTYKALSSKLLVKKRFEEAIGVMDMMKNQGYAPDLDSFVSYLSKNGSAEEAITFTKAMTSNRFPSMSVFIRIFEAYFKEGRRNEAQDFLAKCPRFVRDNADVLNLFCSKKSGGVATAVAM